MTKPMIRSAGKRCADAGMLLALLLVACTRAPTAPSPQRARALPNDIQWFRASAEYRALARQAYRVAEERLPELSRGLATGILGRDSRCRRDGARQLRVPAAPVRDRQRLHRGVVDGVGQRARGDRRARRARVHASRARARRTSRHRHQPDAGRVRRRRARTFSRRGSRPTSCSASRPARATRIRAFSACRTEPRRPRRAAAHASSRGSATTFSISRV